MSAPNDKGLHCGANVSSRADQIKMPLGMLANLLSNNCAITEIDLLSFIDANLLNNLSTFHRLAAAVGYLSLTIPISPQEYVCIL